MWTMQMYQMSLNRYNSLFFLFLWLLLLFLQERYDYSC